MYIILWNCYFLKFLFCIFILILVKKIFHKIISNLAIIHFNRFILVKIYLISKLCSVEKDLIK